MPRKPKHRSAHSQIKIKLKDAKQLFNEIDPDPFREKDLDDEAARYIFNSVREHRLKAPVSLVLFLPSDKVQDIANDVIQEGIHNFFEYEENITRQNLRTLLRDGQMALMVGLFFLFICLSGSHYVLTHSSTMLTHILGEGLNIAGWVAMWKPIDTFLYDWWPLHKTRLYHQKLSSIPIEIKTY